MKRACVNLTTSRVTSRLMGIKLLYRMMNVSRLYAKLVEMSPEQTHRHAMLMTIMMLPLLCNARVCVCSYQRGTGTSRLLQCVPCSRWRRPQSWPEPSQAGCQTEPRSACWSPAPRWSASAAPWWSSGRTVNECNTCGSGERGKCCDCGRRNKFHLHQFGVVAGVDDNSHNPLGVSELGTTQQHLVWT